MKKWLKCFLMCTLIIVLSACQSTTNSDSNHESHPESTKAEASITDNSNIVTSTGNSNIVTSTPTTAPVTAFATPCAHQYKNVTTAPTCTKQGFTTHTCIKCNYSFVDNYIPAAHRFSDYKCKACGLIDKSHTFDYLVSWVLKHGTTSADMCKMETEDGYGIAYNASYNSIHFAWSGTGGTNGNLFLYIGIVIDKISPSYYYSATMGDLLDSSIKYYDMSGYIEPKNFTKNSPLPCNTFESAYYEKYETLEIIREGVGDVLESADRILKGDNGRYPDSGLTIADFGFTAFKY